MTTFRQKIVGWKLPLLGLISLIFTLFAVLEHTKAPSTLSVSTPPIAPYKNNVAGIGVIEPKSELISIGTGLPGIVRVVHVTVGEQIAKGTPLFSLDQRDIDAQIATLTIALESVKLQAEDVAVRFQLVENLQDKRAISKDEYNRRKFAAIVASKKVSEVEAELNQAKTTKERLTIVAPIDGTVIDINVHPGEFAVAGILADPLIRMGDLSTLHVRVEFDEENIVRLSKEAPAKAYMRGDTSTIYPLTFVCFEPYITPKQNLVATGQLVDTRVLQAIYALPQGTDLLTGQQMDVYVQEKSEK